MRSGVSCVHLAPVAVARSIRRAGVRTTRRRIAFGDGLREIAGVFVHPVLPDFSQTYQWLRELRRGRPGRMVAVHVRLPDATPVLVGRYHQPHREMALAAAVAEVRRAPWGAEIVVPRRIELREVVGVREMTQLVGWTQVPPDTRPWECVCIACLTPGDRRRGRKVRAALARAVAAARKASSPEAVAQEIRSASMALEHRRVTLDLRAFFGFARNEDPVVREAAVRALSLRTGEPEVRALLAKIAVRDDDTQIATAAALGLTGSRDALLAVAPGMTEDARDALLDELAWLGDRGEALLDAIARFSPALRGACDAARARADRERSRAR